MDRHPRLLSVIMIRVSLFDHNVLSGMSKSTGNVFFPFLFWRSVHWWPLLFTHAIVELSVSLRNRMAGRRGRQKEASYLRVLLWYSLNIAKISWKGEVWRNCFSNIIIDTLVTQGFNCRLLSSPVLFLKVQYYLVMKTCSQLVYQVFHERNHWRVICEWHLTIMNCLSQLLCGIHWR